MINNDKLTFSHKIKKIFILTGFNVAKNKNVKLIISQIGKNKEIKIFKKKKFLPDILELKKIIREIKIFSPDFIIAIGGGSVIDYSKIANASIHIKNLNFIFKKKVKFRKFRKLLIVPTTAGSGAEVTPGAVIYKKKIKYNLRDKSLIPDRYSYQPQLISSSNKKLKISSTFDSLSQSIESLISFKSNKKSQKYSQLSISLILKNYKKFFLTDDYQTIKKMQIAGNFSGKAISITSTGAPHALSYYLSSTFKLYHGVSVMMNLPSVLEYNFKNKYLLKKGYKKKFEYRINLLKKALGVKNEKKVLDKINDIIKFSKINLKIKKKLFNFVKQKKAININRLKNNPIKISYSQILKFNQKILI